MKKILLVSAVCLLSIVSMFSGCVNVPMDELVQFSIFSFDVEPGIIDQGESANLSWVVIGATSVRIDNGIGSVGLSGHRVIMPTVTTTYTLTALNAETSKEATVQIYVHVEQPTPPQQTPNIVCTTDATMNKIQVAFADVNIKWNDIVITNNTGSSNCHWAIYDGGGVTNQTTNIMPTSDVTAGDSIFIWYPPGGNVKITMRYVPTNALLGTWTINV